MRTASWPRSTWPALEESLPSLQAQQYLEGRFVNTTSGRVYYAFDRREHVRAQRYDPESDLIVACDFNVNPMIWVIAQEIEERGRRPG